jgi:RecJ-like exonuclease
VRRLQGGRDLLCAGCGGEGVIPATDHRCEQCGGSGGDEPPARCAFCDDAPAGGDGFCSDECARGADNEVSVDQRVHEDLEAWS